MKSQKKKVRPSSAQPAGYSTGGARKMRGHAHRLRIRDTRPRASESTKLERESKFWCHEKPTLPKCSAQRNRLGAFPGPIESYDPKGVACKRLSQTNSWLARCVHLKGTKNTNNLVTRKIKLSRPPYYSSSRLLMLSGYLFLMVSLLL